MAAAKKIKGKELPQKFSLLDDFPIPAIEEWKEKVNNDLKGLPYEKLKTKTLEEIELKPIYTKNDLQDFLLADQFPASNNNIRGSLAGGYINDSWLVSQNVSYGDPEEFNSALKKDLNRGQTAILMSLDKATQLGLDADYAKTEDVGIGGVSISGLNSFSRALSGVNIQKNPIFIAAGFSSISLLSLLNAYCKKENINIKNVSGSVEADPIAYLVSEGKLPVSLDFTLEQMAAAIIWSKKNAANIKTVNVSGLVYADSGANSVQELSFVLATANEYIKQMLSAGLSINDIVKSMKITMGIGSSFFTELSKFRAFKLIWKNLLEAYEINKNCIDVHIHAVTTSFNKTLFDPHVNILRTTTEAFSAIMGGINSLYVSPFDEIFSLPNDFSRRIARNTQIILSEESHFSTPIDPAGGSYYVEVLTKEIAQAAWKQFQEIEKNGGMIQSLRDGKIQSSIEATNETRNKLIAKRRSVIVGTNMYANPTETPIKPKIFDNKKLQSQRAQFLQRFRTSGEQSRNTLIIEKLNSLVDEKSEAIIDISTDAIMAGATLGEITHSFRAKVEESFEVKTIEPRRAAESFENIRLKMNEIAIGNTPKPKVFLATLGSLTQFKARADFSRGFFEVAGFDIVYPNGFDTVDQAVKETINSGATISVICSTDENYVEVVPEYAKKLKENNSNFTIVLAGFPKDKEEEYRGYGVDEFIFLGADVYSILSKLV